MKRRKGREAGWTGTWRYASLRSMEAIQSSWLQTGVQTEWSPSESVTRPQSDWDGRGRWPDAMTPRSTTLRTDGCRSLEKEVEQAPEHPWQVSPRWPPPEQPPWWRWGWKKALGWEQWKRRSAEEGQTIAQPQHIYNPSLRTPAPPGLPMEGQTTAGKGPERRRPPPPETRRPGRRSPPPAPLWSAYDHQDERRKETAPTSGNPQARKKEPTPRTLMKRLRPPGREEKEERFPYGLPRGKE